MTVFDSTNDDWKAAMVSPELPLRDAISQIDRSGCQVALVVAPDRTLVGILTDGDIRRAILAGKSLQAKVSEVMNPRPTVVSVFMPRSKMLALMRSKALHHLPLTNANNQVVGLVTLDDLVGVVERPNWVVLMAGGLGTRLQPLTNECPKPLLKVGGKPILEIILESFAEQGFKRIFLSVNYKAEMIQEYFGEGDRWGVQLTYLHERTRLGTAGALSLLPEHPTDSMIVMNGDILTRTNFESLLQFHETQAAMATMAVREYDFQIPYGVVRTENTQIEEIVEKPVQHFFVNAGIYALSPKVLEYLPAETFFDMPTLFQRLIRYNQKTVAYPLREYWLDIGRLEEFDRAQREWGRG